MDIMSSINRGKTRGDASSGGLASPADDIGKLRHGDGPGNTEPCTQVIPEADAEFPTGLGQPEKGVAAIASGIGFGSATDVTLGHQAADVIFRAVGVQRDVWTVEHPQQLGLIGVQTLEQPVQCGKPRVALEYPIEAGAHLVAAAPRRFKAISFQVGVKPPDQPVNMLLGGTLLIGEALQPMHQTLGVYPTQRVLADIELPGIVAEHDSLA